MKSYYKYLWVRIILMCALLFTSNIIFGQLIDFCGTFPYHQATSTDPDSIYWDRFGNSYDIGEMDPVELSGSRSFELCGYFEITYFDMPNPYRDRICEVFKDLSDLIQRRTNFSNCGDSIEPINIKLSIARDS